MDLPALFSGAIIGALVAFITGYFNIRGKDKDYEYTYAKMILEKRILAYERINLIINSLKRSTIDELDTMTYHIVFFSKDHFNDFYQEIFGITSIEFWLSEKTKNSFKKVFDEMSRCFELMTNGENISSVGKNEYQYIGTIRDELERSMLEDMKNLHKINNFFEQKKIETSFYKRNLSDRPK